MHQHCAIQVLVQEPATLSERNRDRDDSADARKVGAGRCEKIEVDVEHGLQLNEELRVEDQVIEGRAHGAVDRVLDGDKGGVDLTPVCGVERVGDRRHRNRFGLGQERDR